MFKKFRLITHNGSFHQDEVFASAVLRIYLKKKFKYPRVEIIRTRDLGLIKRLSSGRGRTRNFIVDVGGKYEPENLLFDHHQFLEEEGKRENGVYYSSFGLVWKEYGEYICDSQEIADAVDKKIVQSIDALDNGVDIFSCNGEVKPYLFYEYFDTYNFLFQESKKNRKKAFMKMLVLAEDILLKEIKRFKIQTEQEKEILDIYKKSEDKRVIVFEKEYDEDVISKVLRKFNEPLFVVIFRGDEDKDWALKTIRKSDFSFEARKDLPQEWAGKRGEDLQKVTGVEDAVFCHIKRFIVVARSREGVLRLARLALEVK